MVKISLNSWLFLLPQTNKATVLSCRSLFGENKFSLNILSWSRSCDINMLRTLRIKYSIFHSKHSFLCLKALISTPKYTIPSLTWRTRFLRTLCTFINVWRLRPFLLGCVLRSWRGYLVLARSWFVISSGLFRFNAYPFLFSAHASQSDNSCFISWYDRSAPEGCHCD